MRYMDVANRLVASPALPIDTKTAFDTVSDWPIGDILVPHRVPPKGIVITAGSRLPTYTLSEIKFFFLLDGFWILKRVFSWN